MDPKEKPSRGKSHPRQSIASGNHQPSTSMSIVPPRSKSISLTHETLSAHDQRYALMKAPRPNSDMLPIERFEAANPYPLRHHSTYKSLCWTSHHRPTGHLACKANYRSSSTLLCQRNCEICGHKLNSHRLGELGILAVAQSVAGLYLAGVVGIGAQFEGQIEPQDPRQLNIDCDSVN